MKKQYHTCLVAHIIYHCSDDNVCYSCANKAICSSWHFTYNPDESKNADEMWLASEQKQLRGNFEGVTRAILCDVCLKNLLNAFHVSMEAFTVFMFSQYLLNPCPKALLFVNFYVGEDETFKAFINQQSSSNLDEIFQYVHKQGVS